MTAPYFYEHTLKLEQTFTKNLPADREEKNFSRQVTNACYSKVFPQKPAAPRLVAYSKEVLALLGLKEEVAQSKDFLQFFSGAELIDGSVPFAMRYGGHQFGHWAGQLGDGRAINLGETNGFTLQLKGAGPTPYSRNSDGFAVLRSSIREFLCSEAMYHLGVPTTRALSLSLTGEDVLRDMFYNGNARYEQGAVVCRVAPSFIRFGSFQILAKNGEFTELKQLTDYSIYTHFKHLITTQNTQEQQQTSGFSIEIYIQFFKEIYEKTLDMVIEWHRVGFVHGVMNTDNMSIHGITIDYGPYGWMENFNPRWTPNTSDRNHRYAYGEQATIAIWNCEQLMLALAEIPFSATNNPRENVELKEVFLKSCSDTLYNYDSVHKKWKQLIAKKLGLRSLKNVAEGSEFVDRLFRVLEACQCDMTIFYRKLADLDLHKSQQELDQLDDNALICCLMSSFYNPHQITKATLKTLVRWLKDYATLIRKDGLNKSTRKEKMDAVNPKYLLRNYLVQVAIEKAEDGDFSEISNLLNTLRAPYDEQPERQNYAQKRPKWADDKAGCSALSCSS